MNKRHLIILALVALSGLAAVFWSQNIDEPRSSENALVPGLLDSINEVSQVRISTSDSAVTLNRNDTGWTVGEISDYTADSGKLRALLLAIARAEKIEPKTTNPDLYAQLGVADPGSAVGAGVSIELDGVTMPAPLLVGLTSPSLSDTTYVRYADDPQSWLIDQELSIDREPADWVNRLVIDLPPETVRSLAIIDANGERFSLSRESSGTEYQIGELPQGKLLKQSEASRFAGELGGFNFDNVEPAGESEPGADSFVINVETFGGARIVGTLSKTDDKNHMTLSASAIEGATPDAEASAAIDAVSRRAGWRFEIPAFKYNQLNKKRDELLEDAS